MATSHSSDAASAQASHPARAGCSFIVGCPRSGTTLLQQLMASHPECCSAPETHFLTHVLPRELAVPGRPLSPAELDACLTRLADKPGIVLEPAERAELDRRLAATGADPAAVLDALMRVLGSRGKAVDAATLWIEKTPRHVFHLAALRKLFPAARVIHLVRDPRGVAASLIERRAGELNVNPDARLAYVLGRAVEWRRVQRAAAPFSAEMLTVTYEQLVRKTEATLQRVWDFLGLAPNPHALRDFAEQHRHLTVAGGEPHKQLNAAATIVDGSEVWRERLSPTENGLVEFTAGPWLARCGYVAEHGSIPVSLTWRLRAWSKLLKYRRRELLGRSD